LSASTTFTAFATEEEKKIPPFFICVFCVFLQKDFFPFLAAPRYHLVSPTYVVASLASFQRLVRSK
jgi:hypothetical protein